MKNNIKKVFGITVFLVFLLAFGINVSAVGIDVNANATVGVTSTTKSSASATGTVKMESGEKDDDNKSATSTKEDEDDNGQGEEHRSAVAVVVRNLLSIADRDGGIGADVRLVAEEQASTSAKIKDDMNNLDHESKVKVFFFGPNYKNLGDLRSSVVTTQNHIERLKKAESRTTDASVKADLQVQIKALEGVASSTQMFVYANESKLSILGWFVKIFSK